LILIAIVERRILHIHFNLALDIVLVGGQELRDENNGTVALLMGTTILCG
jgi:hypothetical protein